MEKKATASGMNPWSVRAPNNQDKSPRTERLFLKKFTLVIYWWLYLSLSNFLAEITYPNLHTFLEQCTNYGRAVIASFTRTNLSENLKSLFLLKAYGSIMSTPHLHEFGKYPSPDWLPASLS